MNTLSQCGTASQSLKFISRRPLDIKGFSTDTKMNMINVVCCISLRTLLTILGMFCLKKQLIVNVSLNINSNVTLQCMLLKIRITFLKLMFCQVPCPLPLPLLNVWNCLLVSVLKYLSLYCKLFKHA